MTEKTHSGSTLLRAKLTPPPVTRDLVVRPRLLRMLDAGLNGPLTLVVAPAGFGKTTLVSEWVAGSGRPVAWLSLDEGDNDLPVFLTYLVAALQTIAAYIGEETLAALQSPQPPSAELILTPLLNEIAAIPDDFILVLDDYHALDSETIDQALAFLLEHLPPRMCLVVATREDPSLPLARRRARNQLTELRAADLQFTPTEAAEFLNRVMGLHLSDSDVAALETRTEGWIAGLQLAALSMQGRSDTAAFIQAFTGSHRFVLDYLVEEVLQQQPENIQTFLLRTAILDRLCGPLCDAVLLAPPASGQQTLEHLERANLFIVPLDSERRWYRYHHLFGDLLRRQLGQPPELADLHLRASAWHEANNDLAEAFNHAQAAGDFERAARLAEVAWPDMERAFRSAAWLGWVDKLPDAVIGARPGLCVLIGEALSDIGDVGASESYLQKAEQALALTRIQDESRSLSGTIAMIRAGNAQIEGNLPETVKYTELAIQLTPKENVYLLTQALITLGFTHWATGDLEASLHAMHVWMDDMARFGNPMFVAASAFAAADMEVELGRLNDAKKTLRQGIQRAGALGQDGESVTAHHHLGLALLAHEQGDESTMTQHLQIAADLGRRTTLIDWPYRWNLAQARLKESAGEWDAALDFLDEAGRVYVKNPIPMLRPVEAIKARIFLKQGRPDKAASWARQRGLSVSDAVNYPDEYEFLTLARVRLAGGDFTGVDTLLERLLALAETQKRTGSVIAIRLTQALVHLVRDNLGGSLAALERALALAEPEGYLRVFVDEGEAMRRLLLKFRSTNAHPAARSRCGYVDNILGAFAPPAELTAKSVVTTRGATIIEPLTARELEILRLVADGQSNAEIGRRLFLALSTVKGHNLRIFGKLGVQNRTEAVARARELGLI